MFNRLVSAQDFERVKREGTYWSGRRCGINAARRKASDAATETGASLVRVGFITSKKVGGAVQRNRARRLLRESMRSLAPLIESCWDIVVIARPAIAMPSVRMQDMREELLWLLNKAHLLKSDKSLAAQPESDSASS
jgi:ribonuclease P protein component